MKDFMEGFKAWIKTRKLPQRRLSVSELQTLHRASDFEKKVKSSAAAVRRIFIDLCAVAAAVFSALSYFKQ